MSLSQPPPLQQQTPLKIQVPMIGKGPGNPTGSDAPSTIGPYARPGSPLQTKARKACLNCRRQKMKCRIDTGESCRRCAKAGVPCVFVPRANASYLRDLIVTSDNRDSNQAAFNQAVESRLKRLEEYLGLCDEPTSSSPTPQSTAITEATPDNDVFSALFPAIQSLRKIAPPGLNPQIWDRKTLSTLWQTFHSAMPGLHFLPSKQTFSTPRPLLLAAMLYCSSVRGGPEVATLANDFLLLLTSAIAQLCIPHSPLNTPPSEEWAFQSVLGLILAGLLREAVNSETGLWISFAYRLLLEHCPAESARGAEWCCLFSGLQIVDLEHASLGLLCPVVPVAAPWPRLQVSQNDQLYRLSRMMHTGLTHFTGRGLSTVMSIFNGTLAANVSLAAFTPVDAAVIRDWARQLDDWLVEFSALAFESEHEKKVVFRQYVLHRLFVLSIYHPARGCNLFANGITPNEQHELLISARAAVRLHIYDKSIWSNWDLVIITWAALIVLQGVEGGVGEPSDVEEVGIHLENLRSTHEPGVSMREMLAEKLEGRMTNMQSPVALVNTEPEVEDPSNWYIFNEASLQNGYELW